MEESLVVPQIKIISTPGSISKKHMLLAGMNLKHIMCNKSQSQALNSLAQ